MRVAYVAHLKRKQNKRLKVDEKAMSILECPSSLRADIERTSRPPRSVFAIWAPHRADRRCIRNRNPATRCDSSAGHHDVDRLGRDHLFARPGSVHPVFAHPALDPAVLDHGLDPAFLYCAAPEDPACPGSQNGPDPVDQTVLGDACLGTPVDLWRPLTRSDLWVRYRPLF